MDGKPVYNRSPPVAWDHVCKKKNEGGLGIRDCKKWNLAAIGKLIWDIASKADKLWVKWVNHVYIKDHDWWSYEPKNDSSWVWSKICKVRDLFVSAYHEGESLHHKDGRYTVKSGYQFLRGNAPWVRWDS